MTDKEIEKALECCAETLLFRSDKKCAECPYFQQGVDCVIYQYDDLRDYINRLKTENGKLQQQVVKFEKMKCMDDCTVCPYGSIISQNATDYVAIEKEQIRKDTAKNFAETLITLLWEENKGETITIKDLHNVIKDVAKAQYGVGVEK